MAARPDAVGRIAAWVACALGLASAAVSAYWAIGGTALLDTIGGRLEELGRERSAGVVVGLAAVAVLKVVVAVAAPLATGAVQAPAWVVGVVPRVLSWTAAIVLTLYGGLLTVVGLLVLAGAFEAADDADRHALAWHAWCWDPWFLVWGAAFIVAMWRSRSDRVIVDADAG